MVPLGHAMYLWIEWGGCPWQESVSIVRKENKAGHVSYSCSRLTEGAAFVASTSRAKFCLVLGKDHVGSSSQIFQICLLWVPV